MQNDVDMGFKDKPQLSGSNFKVFLGFCNSLRWRLGEGLACSVFASLLLDKGNKCNGKTFPKGALRGAEAYLDNATLELLVRAFDKGGSSLDEISLIGAVNRPASRNDGEVLGMLTFRNKVSDDKVSMTTCCE